MVELLLRATVFCLIGIGVFSLDMKTTAFLSKYFKNYKGIIIGKGRTRNRVIMMIVVMILIFVVTRQLFGGKHDLSKVFMNTVIEGSAMMFGFYIALWAIPRIPKLFKKSKAYLEKLEEGKTNPFKDVKDAIVDSAKSGLTTSTEKDAAKETNTEKVTEEKPVVVEEEKPAIAAEEKDNRTPQKKMNDGVEEFLKRK